MTTNYTPSFYARQRDGSLTSSTVIAPIVLSHFPVKSVVDVGCGVGGWLSAFRALGVEDYLGIDGDYVPAEMRKIPSVHFRSADLRTLKEIGRKFDLACSLEVAEHLPESCSEQFVAMLVRAAPVVLFSAAIPEQEGNDHINLQWQSYWCKLFQAHKYVAVDCVRPVVCADPRVEWWYRQNTLVYCRPELCPPNYSALLNRYDVDRIDPDMLRHVAGRPNNGRQAIAALRRSTVVLTRTVSKRLRTLTSPR